MRHVLVLFLLASCGPSATVEGGADGGVDQTGGDTGDDGEPGVGACTDVKPISGLAGPKPDLLLVVNRSESMSEPLAGGEDKLSALTSAVTQVVVGHHAFLELGLMLFPSNDGCAAGTITTHIGEQSWQGIANDLYSTTAAGGSPAHTTLRMAQLYFESVEPNPEGRYILLATDGVPACRTIFEPEDPSLTETLDALTDLRDLGIPTFVLGLGDADGAMLDEMAAAGGTGTAYRGTSAAELDASLRALTYSVSSPDCSVPLSKAPENLDAVEVYLDDELVPEGDWYYDAATNFVRVTGASCERLQSGLVEDIVVFRGCPPPDIE